MRYAVLSDIHANLEALTAVLGALAAQKIDRILCLGDVIGYGADPAECLGRLQEAGALIVKGNHEAACSGSLDPGWFNRAAKDAILWTRDQLGFTELNDLRRLPMTEQEGPCTLVHASLRHPERFEYLLDVASMIDTLSICRTAICLAGHTHQPCFIEYDRSGQRVGALVAHAEGMADLALPPDGGTARCLLNPGSVGQPRDGDPRASFAVLDTETRRAQLKRVAYDIPAAQQKIRAAGLPGILADRLAMGR